MEGNQLSGTRARRGRPCREQMADGQCGLKEGTPSWAVAWGQAQVGGAQGCTQQHGRRAASEDGRQERADAGCAGEVGAWREGGLKVTIKPSSPEALVSVCPGLRPVSERLVSTERAHHPLHPWPAAVTVP